MIVKYFLQEHATHTDFIFVALDDVTQEITGTARLYKHHDTTEEPCQIPVLCELFIHPDYRRRGIGQALQIAREQKAKEYFGAITVALWVAKDSWMHTWYCRRGYDRPKDKDEKNIWMYKTFN